MSASSKHFKYLCVQLVIAVLTSDNVLVANGVQCLSLSILEPVHKVLRANELPVELHLFGLLARVYQVLQERQLAKGFDLGWLFEC